MLFERLCDPNSNKITAKEVRIINKESRKAGNDSKMSLPAFLIEFAVEKAKKNALQANPGSAALEYGRSSALGLPEIIRLTSEPSGHLNGDRVDDPGFLKQGYEFGNGEFV